MILAILVAGAGSAFVLIPQTRQLEDQLSGDFVSAQAHLEAGKAKLEKANADRNPVLLDGARTEFKAAQSDFTRARHRIDSNPLLLAGSVLPIASAYVGPRERTVLGLTNLGLALSAAALEGVEVDSLFLKPDAQGAGPARLVAVLRAAQPKLQSSKADLQRAQEALNMVDPSVLPAGQREAVTKAAATVAKGAASIEQITGLLPVLLEILGANGPRTYLIEQVNPAELRAGGGFIGTYSLMSADQGTLKLVKSGAIDDVDYPRATVGQPGFVQSPPPLAEFTGNTSWVLGDSNFFPDFVTNAKWGETFADKEIKAKPDGVISIDPYFIAALLDITGPIPVADFGVTVQSKGFVTDLFYREAGANRQPNRKAFLASVADELVTRIATLPADRWPALLQALNTAASQRHLQVYFNHAGAEKEMTTYGWSGVLNQSAKNDFLYEVESNFGATKANFFVARSYEINLSVKGDKLHHDVAVNLVDTAPSGISGRAYRYYVRMYVPAAATDLKIGQVFPDKLQLTEVPSGLKMVDGWYQNNVDPRTGVGRTQIGFSWDTPLPSLTKPFEIYWQKQPGTLNDGAHIIWSVGGHRFEATGDLAQDRVITLTPTGVTLTPGQAGTAQLPSLSF